MAYQVIIPKAVQKQLDVIQAKTRVRILSRVQALAETPQPPGSIKLKNQQNTYRIRIGDYRVVYEIDQGRCIVLLLKCQHRREVYRKS